jgi:hypothetical protein
MVCELSNLRTFTILRLLATSFFLKRKIRINEAAKQIKTTMPVNSFTKSIKLKFAAKPMIIFGGSPIKVAAPPMFEHKISPIKNGIGSLSSILQTAKVMGITKITVVTLSKKHLQCGKAAKQNKRNRVAFSHFNKFICNPGINTRTAKYEPLTSLQ